MLTRTTIFFAFLANGFVCNPQPKPAVTGEESSGGESSSGTTETTVDSTTNPTDSTGSSSTTSEPMCGDGVPEGDEECDDGNQEPTDDCLNNCKMATCGDDQVWEGKEQCDDGDQIDTNACTAVCKPAVCGDGIKWEGKEECDDGNQENADGCTNECMLPKCGDGMKTGREECDDGQNNAPPETATPEQCTTACKIACGDGTQSDKEECDDGSLEANDGCSPTCTDEFIMFVTAETYPGNFGGVAAADEICQMAAMGKLTGTYVAWISASMDNAPTDIPAGKPIIRPDGMVIVNVAEDLFKDTDTMLMNAIAVDVDGNAVGGYAWTGTSSAGTYSGLGCGNWLELDPKAGSAGDVLSMGPTWTLDDNAIDEFKCSAMHHLYCFRKADL